MTLMRIELVRVFIVDAPRFSTTDKGQKLMSVSVIANPDPKAVDKEGYLRYNSFRVSCTVNITNTPWKAKAQKGDPIYMSGNAMMRIYESKSEKAPFGVGVELEIRFPDRFEILVDKKTLDARTEGASDAPASGVQPARTRTRTRTRQPAKQEAPPPTDDDLPEGLDDDDLPDGLDD